MMLKWFRKHWKYGGYMVRHKWYVFKECLAEELWVEAITHDLSKFLPWEWSAYAEYFYGDGKNVNEFNVAWKHHQWKNPHHWQHWVLFEDSGEIIAMDMPERKIREMICDWRGGGRAITGKDNTEEWYMENRFRMRMSPATRLYVETKLGFDLEQLMPDARKFLLEKSYRIKPLLDKEKEKKNG
jgi:hypothetical protein